MQTVLGLSVTATNVQTVLVEGRDAAGKGGVIKRIAERTNARQVRIAALGTPTEREKTQWYFQRYAAHLPAAGEIVLFDRSWYNRAGVEHVMGFCTTEEYQDFLRSAPEFERMLVRSGIILVKYWFSVSDEEQERRFQARVENPLKRWKLSPMDLQSRVRWEAYTKAKEAMLERTHIDEAPWWIVPADDKKKARLNCIQHLLSQMPYVEVERQGIELPQRERREDYTRQPVPDDMLVGEPTAGWSHALSTMANERVAIGAYVKLDKERHLRALAELPDAGDDVRRALGEVRATSTSISPPAGLNLMALSSRLVKIGRAHV